MVPKTMASPEDHVIGDDTNGSEVKDMVHPKDVDDRKGDDCDEEAMPEEESSSSPTQSSDKDMDMDMEKEKDMGMMDINDCDDYDNAAVAANDGTTDEEEKIYVSHFQNTEAHSEWVRYGLPLFMVATLALLINADVGSGVSADYILVRDGEIIEQKSLLIVSVFTSVGELWRNKSYPLALWIAITSISWPYLKLLLGFYAWVMPYKNPRKREFLVEVLDAFGKWSFVDIVVLVEIMVAFRSEIKLAPTVTLNIVLDPKWGFYGFIFASMMSLLSTHIILFYHRRVHYHSPRRLAEHPASLDPESANANGETAEDDMIVTNDMNDDKAGVKALEGLSNGVIVIAVIGVVISIVFFMIGCFVDMFKITQTRGDVHLEVDYSVVSIGKAIPSSGLDPNELGTNFIQFMWFFLCVVMPIWCSFLFGVLFVYPFSRKNIERIFFMGEIAFAWSCAEVLFISTIFAVLQMPTFGDGLVKADCTSCFLVDTVVLPQFAFITIGAVFNVGINIWLYRKAHHAVYRM